MPYKTNDARRLNYRKKAHLKRLVSKRWSDANKDKVLATAKRFRDANKDLCNANNREYYRKNKDALVEYQRLYRLNNKDKIRTYKQSAKRRTADVIRVHRRRERLINGDDATLQFYILSNSEKIIKCYWCGKKTKQNGREVDHILPLALGGSAASSNLCIACKTCNRKKSKKHPNEFSKQGVLLWLNK